VRLLERDPDPPPLPQDAWDQWTRRGVNQFNMVHFFLPRFRELLETELPDVAAALEANGALRFNFLAGVPDEVSGGPRPGDERFTALTGRRPFVEATVAAMAAAEPRLEVVRGTAVTRLLAGPAAVDGGPHVQGVGTGAGSELRADLVVDASGRRSSLPDWLAALGARPPHEEREDSGFVYYGRHFRSADGSLPAAFGPPLQHYDSVSLLLLPADNGTWGVGIVASAADPAMRVARRLDVWERVVASYPLAAHWLDGEPISDVAVMAKIEDRCRRYVDADGPVATGVVALGDSWACTNPSVGRGASIAMLHAVCLRDLLRELAPDDPAFIRRWDEVTAQVVEPLYRDTLAFDNHRLAEIGAQIAGVPYETDDPGWLLGQALGRAAFSDPELLRATVAIGGLLERAVDVMSRPGVVDKVLALGGDDGEPAPGPDRAGLLAILEH
jgi:2-polyprenyl-6-methoxyphenol hydroxylase-like FAD-dependent oxidoreductase